MWKLSTNSKPPLICFLACSIFNVFLGLDYLAFADISNSSSGKVVLKAQEVQFVPERVYLLIEQKNLDLNLQKLNFRLSPIRDSADSKLSTFVASSPVSTDIKPLAILSRSGFLNPAEIVADSVLLDSKDIFDTSSIDGSRSKILEKRAELTTYEKQLKIKSQEVDTLKAKAASIARLNRLVEAETTVASLSRKLEGLKIDLKSAEDLLQLVAKQTVGIRLANSEASLSRDLKELSQKNISAIRKKRIKFTDQQREEAYRTVEKAKGLDLESLRQQVQLYRSDVGAE